MSNFKPNSSFSIASSTSISILPSRDIYSHRLNSAEFLRFLLEDDESKNSGRVDKVEFFPDDELNTIREFEDADENVATIRPEPYVFCTNCFDNIEVDFIDEHSMVCVKPLESYNKVLSKVRYFLAWVRELKLDCKDIYLFPLILLEDIAKKILSNRNVISTQELLNCFERINSIIRDYNQYPMILMAAQRISLISEALLSENDEILQEPLPKINIEVIDSTLQLSKVQQDSFISGYSDISIEFTKGRSSPAESPEALEKYFYSQCLKIKMKNSANKDFSMFRLYQDCIEKNVPVEDWKKFIKEALWTKD